MVKKISEVGTEDELSEDEKSVREGAFHALVSLSGSCRPSRPLADSLF